MNRPNEKKNQNKSHVSTFSGAKTWTECINGCETIWTRGSIVCAISALTELDILGGLRVMCGPANDCEYGHAWEWEQKTTMKNSDTFNYEVASLASQFTPRYDCANVLIRLTVSVTYLVAERWRWWWFWILIWGYGRKGFWLAYF